MGGSMNVFDFHIHVWMQEEIAWVRRYMDAGKPVIGICLGAQIIAGMNWFRFLDYLSGLIT